MKNTRKVLERLNETPPKIPNESGMYLNPDIKTQYGLSHSMIDDKLLQNDYFEEENRFSNSYIV